ncbi:MAG: integrase family protein, partial [Anaerolineales bacterium]|nr:integrase family protein [Anaerolineales bacterium]
MVERVRLEGRKPKSKMYFTDLALQKLRPPKKGQVQVWDDDSEAQRGVAGQRGLSLLISKGGAKTYRSTYVLHGKAISRKLGRIDELTLAEARDIVRQDRRMAKQGKDPKAAVRKTDDPKLYKEAVTDFVDQVCKIEQKQWKQSQDILLRYFDDWFERSIDTITEQEIRDRINHVKVNSGPRAAKVAHVKLCKLWDWCLDEKIVEANVARGFKVKHKSKKRDRYYSDSEVKDIWNAGNNIDAIRGSYIKLLLLLAPRKSELAHARWNEFKFDFAIKDRRKGTEFTLPALWEIPHSRTKTKGTADARTYLVPLPALAKRILIGLKPKDARPNDLVFPGRKAGRTIDPSGPLVNKLV